MEHLNAVQTTTLAERREEGREEEGQYKDQKKQRGGREDVDRCKDVRTNVGVGVRLLLV